MLLADLEAVFRSLKSELGLRPIYHSKPERSAGHLFVTVLAYQLVQVIQRRLRDSAETASWTVSSPTSELDSRHGVESGSPRNGYTALE